MIKVLLNGKKAQLPSGLFINEAIDHWGYKDQAFAIAINENFVPRCEYQTVTIKEGDQVELVSPIQGG